MNAVSVGDMSSRLTGIHVQALTAVCCCSGAGTHTVDDLSSIISIFMYIAAPLFEESGGGGQRSKGSAKISLLEDDDGDLFVPSGARGGKEEGERFEAEDNSELLKYVCCVFV